MSKIDTQITRHIKRQLRQLKGAEWAFDERWSRLLQEMDVSELSKNLPPQGGTLTVHVYDPVYDEKSILTKDFKGYTDFWIALSDLKAAYRQRLDEIKSGREELSRSNVGWEIDNKWR